MPPVQVGLAAATIFVVTLAGCSSGGPKMPGADAAVDVRVGADDGGLDAADAADVADVVGEVSAATLDEACRTALAAECHRYGTCLQMPSTDACTAAFADLCPFYYFNADSTRTLADAQACATAFAAVPCTDFQLGVFPSCLAPGVDPNGSACAYNSQCQSGWCSSPTGCGGTCYRTIAAAGEPCGTSSTVCDRQTFCHPQQHVCVPIDSIVHAIEGQPCDLQADPVVGCVGDLICARLDATGTAGTCTHLPLSGEPCLSATLSIAPCAEGFECGDGAKCWPVNTCSGTMTCDPASACVRGDGGMTCVPPGVEGAACGVGGGQPVCDSTTVCVAVPNTNPVTGICTRFVSKGGACDGSSLCAGYLSCIDGACNAPDPATCAADAGVD